MRSGVTAGLTPQQLLDRRRAQNKLAQRRFREKAKQTRTVESNAELPSASGSSSASCASSTHSSPVAQPSGLPGVDASISFSDCEHSTANHGSPKLETDSSVPQLTLSRYASAGFSERPDSSAFVGTTMVPQAPANVDLNLAPKFQENLSPSAVLSLRGDPFLTSLAMPSPSMLTEATYRFYMPSPSQTAVDANAATAFRPTMLTPTSAVSDGAGLSKTGSDLYDRRSSLSFELILRSETPMGPKAGSAEPTSYFSDVSTSVTPPLSTTLSDSSQEHSVSTPESRRTSSSKTSGDNAGTQAATDNAMIEESISTFPIVMFNTMSYASALRLMVSKADKRPPTHVDWTTGPYSSSLALWQHLKVLSRSLQVSADPLQNDGIMWSNMPENMLPTQEQQQHCSHHRCIDLGLPWPSVRSALLRLAQNNRLCLDEFLLDIFLSLVLPTQQPSFYVYGDDPYDTEAWELSPTFAAKWGGLFEASIIRRSSWWRRQRGLPAHTVTHTDNARLGTGSLDESSRIWATAFPSIPLRTHL